MSRISLINLADLTPGQSAEVVAEGKIFAVFNVDGTVFVLDGICPHAGGPLGKGSLRGDVVTCPWHGWQFQVSSGQHCLNSRICQTKYETIIEDGRIMIEA
ncbi:MAG: Rieske 2Fe-2S domain-containing protein [Planctomycetaceae bacterium]